MAMFMPHIVEEIEHFIHRAAQGESLVYRVLSQEVARVHYLFAASCAEEAAQDDAENRLSFQSGGSLSFTAF